MFVYLCESFAAGSRAGALAELVCVGGVLQQMCCLCMWGMGQPCWLCACEGDAGEGELTVVNRGVVQLGEFRWPTVALAKLSVLSCSILRRWWTGSTPSALCSSIT